VKINVIDLDKTLIPYDSFRVLIIREIKKIDVFLIGITVSRLLKFTPSEQYKKRASLYLQKKHSDEFFKNFANELFNDIDKKVLQLIHSHTQKNTINILLSASPNLFVKHLVKKLKWSGSGSYNSDGTFVHLYGSNKTQWLFQNYNTEDYDYNFAISDSSSDDELLSLFRENKKWVNHQ